jgi:hypothetical protein
MIGAPAASLDHHSGRFNIGVELYPVTLRAGESAEEPPPPPVRQDPGPDPFQLAVQLHVDLMESARPWARVNHLEYDPARYADLVGSFAFAVIMPPTISWAAHNLSAAAHLAARVAKNADDDTYQRLIDEARQVTPAAAACALRRELAIVAREDDRSALAEQAAAAYITTLWSQDWSDPAKSRRPPRRGHAGREHRLP